MGVIRRFKNSVFRGHTDKHTDKHTNIATYRKIWSKGRFSEKNYGYTYLNQIRVLLSDFCF